MVTSSHLKGACGACGGDLRLTVPCAVRRTQLTVFRNVAAFHGLPLLQEMAEWLIQDGQIGL
jgi:DNA polymerase epsilon subunit 1